MREVFLDTVGLLALWDSTDQWHESAQHALAGLAPEVRTVTTSFVLLECGNAAAGIVDHISFAVMRRLGIAEVFGNDRHFQAAGFTVLF